MPKMSRGFEVKYIKDYGDISKFFPQRSAEKSKVVIDSSEVIAAHLKLAEEKLMCKICKNVAFDPI